MRGVCVLENFQILSWATHNRTISIDLIIKRNKTFCFRAYRRRMSDLRRQFFARSHRYKAVLSNYSSTSFEPLMLAFCDKATNANIGSSARAPPNWHIASDDVCKWVKYDRTQHPHSTTLWHDIFTHIYIDNRGNIYVYEIPDYTSIQRLDNSSNWTNLPLTGTSRARWLPGVIALILRR